MNPSLRIVKIGIAHGRVKLALTFIYSLFLLASFTAGSIAHAAQGSDTTLQLQKLHTLRNTVEQLQRKLDSDKDKHSALRNKLRSAEKAVGRVVRKLDAVNGRLKSQQKKMQTLQRQRKKLQAELTQQRRVLASQIRTAYAIGRQEYMKLLLNQKDPSVMGRTLVQYDYLNRARTEQIGVIRQDVERLAVLEREITTQTAKLEDTRDKRLQQKRKLDQNRKARSKVLKVLDRQIRTRKQKLNQAKADIKQLEDLMRGLRRALADVPINAGQRKSFRSQKGRMRLPVRGRISSRYGSKRNDGGLRWQGVMIRAKQGSEVRTISHGRVAFADWLRGFGLMVIVDHGDGYMSLYGHNDSLYVETGDWLEPGEVIASVGTSGGRKRPSLYFEIRHKGKPSNPLRWVRRN